MTIGQIHNLDNHYYLAHVLGSPPGRVEVRRMALLPPLDPVKEGSCETWIEPRSLAKADIERLRNRPTSSA